jgi:hypothetical protein
MHIAHTAAQGGCYAGDERTHYHCKSGKNCRDLRRASCRVRRGFHLRYSLIDATLSVSIRHACLRGN